MGAGVVGPLRQVRQGGLCVLLQEWAQAEFRREALGQRVLRLHGFGQVVQAMLGDVHAVGQVIKAAGHIARGHRFTARVQPHWPPHGLDQERCRLSKIIRQKLPQHPAQAATPVHQTQLFKVCPKGALPCGQAQRHAR